MVLELICNLLAWCTLINFVLLIFWVAIFYLAHDCVYNLTAKCFKLEISKGSFDIINYSGIGLFKMFIIMFNLVPYIVLRSII
jgi:hypothetical protein